MSKIMRHCTQYNEAWLYTGFKVKLQVDYIPWTIFKKKTKLTMEQYFK